MSSSEDDQTILVATYQAKPSKKRRRTRAMRCQQQALAGPDAATKQEFNPDFRQFKTNSDEFTSMGESEGTSDEEDSCEANADERESIKSEDFKEEPGN